MSIIIVHGAIEIKQDCMDDAVALSVSHVSRSRQEAGCLSHNVHVDMENKSRLVFYETWQDLQALHAHFALEASKDFINQLSKMGAGKPVMKVFESSEVG